MPLTAIATELGKPLVKNIAALGALCAATELFPAETFLAAIRQMLKGKSALRHAQRRRLRARRAGDRRASDDVSSEPKCARMQADGVPCDCADADCEACAEAARYAARLKTPS